MKKSLIGSLALGLVIGAGVMGATSFANEKEASVKAFSNNENQIVSTIDQNSSTQGDAQFKVLNQETKQFEKVDDSEYRNSNPNYGQGCPHMNYGSFGNENIN
ncbi:MULTISPECIES: hypothetical protein [Paraclostridium]|uniref:hypothetical protein n=1 Tax=Paraclostridium TaxID=1849822 RepID=UPI00051D0C0B|nr:MULTISPECIES: hypothetical protein [Paraclostridium]KGJ50729.1 hypothetical protein KD33_01710 [Clostridium sp. NCR]MCU9813118.1 hypothetical protein [Paraclostridium sp. AKS81]